MQGKIIKGISGFYYVQVEESGIYECKAKGAFRKDKIKPLVGDDVEIDVIHMCLAFRDLRNDGVDAGLDDLAEIQDDREHGDNQNDNDDADDFQSFHEWSFLFYL